MCCGTKVCCFFMCLVLVVVAIGLLFGFGVFKNGFHRLENTMHDCSSAATALCSARRPFLGFNAPPRS